MKPVLKCTVAHGFMGDECDGGENSFTAEWLWGIIREC